MNEGPWCRHCNALQCTATTALQHTATQRDTLQHTATHWGNMMEANERTAGTVYLTATHWDRTTSAIFTRKGSEDPSPRGTLFRAWLKKERENEWNAYYFCSFSSFSRITSPPSPFFSRARRALCRPSFLICTLLSWSVQTLPVRPPPFWQVLARSDLYQKKQKNPHGPQLRAGRVKMLWG